MVVMRPSVLSSCVLLSLTIQAMSALIDLQLITGKHSTCLDTHSKVDPGPDLNGDFNQDVGKVYVWLCIQDGLYDPTTAITDLTIVRSLHDSLSGCGSLLDSQGWKRIGQDQGSDGDFNQGIDGGWIYMCYQKNSDHPPVERLQMTEKDECPLGTRVHAASGNTADDDLQAGKHKHYIYLCAARGCVASDVQGSWTPRMVISAPIDETWMHGTSFKDTDSYTSDWSVSVTAEVSADLIVASSKVSTEITAEVSQTYQREWTDTEQHEFTVHFTSDYVGKQSWQFVFTTHDNCNRDTDSLTREFAATEGIWRAPCCLPGYSIDAPAYTKCYSSDALISSGPNCSVATPPTSVWREHPPIAV